MTEHVDFDAEFDEDIDFEADDEFEEALGARHGIDVDELKARGIEMFESAREKGRERLYTAAGRGKERLAEALDNTATRLDDRLYGGSAYLRNQDVEVIASDLIEQIKKRPLLSAGIALGAGYLVGKATGIGGSKKPGRKLVRKQIGRQIRRAIVSSIAAAVASRMQETIAAATQPDPPRRRPRPKKQPAI
jgi:hypothetical protein